VALGFASRRSLPPLAGRRSSGAAFARHFRRSFCCWPSSFFLLCGAASSPTLFLRNVPLFSLPLLLSTAFLGLRHRVHLRRRCAALQPCRIRGAPCAGVGPRLSRQYASSSRPDHAALTSACIRRRALHRADLYRRSAGQWSFVVGKPYGAIYARSAGGWRRRWRVALPRRAATASSTMFVSARMPDWRTGKPAMVSAAGMPGQCRIRFPGRLVLSPPCDARLSFADLAVG